MECLSFSCLKLVRLCWVVMEFGYTASSLNCMHLVYMNLVSIGI